ncbi:metalloprotease TldD [Candidatus Methylomirabilis sp.]|uniref:metalloprotease TldD n=1 Tax=Candidatus Methylomirabilis sp. TaxID=2032687 RepID=UPI002A5E6666|nr:metalloprotease TldD [Candidatus Methylomirabilis sp.]
MTIHPMKPERFFLEKFGLTERHLERGLGAALGAQVDDADLYFEYRISESLLLEEGIIKQAAKNINQGVGVRALAHEKTGYAFSDEISLENLELAGSRAKEIAERAGVGTPPPVKVGGSPPHDLYPVRVPPVEIPLEKKIDLLQQIDIIARQADPRIVQVMASFACESKIVMIATSAGVMIGDIQPLSRLSITCIAQEGENRQIGSWGGGGRADFEFFLERDRFEHYAKEAVRLAIMNLNAADAPAGTMDVVLGPGWPGILLHEAIGHGLEGDFNRKKTSAFSDRIGQRVASELVTVVDDGTIPGRRGSLNVDDEGTPTSRTVLIERGILRGYLQDRLNARLMGMEPTGNGRRESYAHQPLPRMTNTFMLPGDSTSEEIIGSVKHGLYAVTFGGGQVDITSGKFVFSASEAYIIEDGKITKPVKGATLIGHGPEVLTRVTMVGNDLKLDEGVGTCGKDGQSVPVGVGLPTIKIEGLTVGGTLGLQKGGGA